MGLDGISINQLQSVPQRSSSELNSNVNFNTNQNTKIVDGLSEGQIVDPDKHKGSNNKNSGNKQKEFDNQDEQEEQIEEPVVKHDLSKTEKYTLKLDENSDKISIVEKSTGEVIQTFDAEQLANFVGFMSQSCGAIVNKKF